MTEAGARAGVLALGEQQVIANVFELDTRMVNSVMTSSFPTRLRREQRPEKLRLVDAKDMFKRVLNGQPLSLGQGLPLLKALVIPDRISLTEVAGAATSLK